jgi:hypothetical protein
MPRRPRWSLPTSRPSVSLVGRAPGAAVSRSKERPVPAERGAQQLGVRAVFLPQRAKARLPPLKGREQRLGVAGLAQGAPIAGRRSQSPAGVGGLSGGTGAGPPLVARGIPTRRTPPPSCTSECARSARTWTGSGSGRMLAPRRPHPPRAQRWPGLTQVALAQARPRRQARLVLAYLRKGDTFAELAADSARQAQRH